MHICAFTSTCAYTCKLTHHNSIGMPVCIYLREFVRMYARSLYSPANSDIPGSKQQAPKIVFSEQNAGGWKPIYRAHIPV